jgi:hypothetical protein
MDAAAQLVILQEMLAEVVAALRKCEVSPRTRELRARVSTYERVVGGWAFRPATAAQYSAMRECVEEVHAMVVAPPRSVRPPPWSPGKSTRPPVSGGRHTRTTRPPPPPPPSTPPGSRR